MVVVDCFVGSWGGLLVHGSSLRSDFWLKSSCELKLGWSWVMGCNAGTGFRVGGSGL